MGHANTEYANTEDTKAATDDAPAHEMLRRAYEAAYRFPPGFGGFRASAYRTWDLEGGSGTVEVRSPSDFSVNIQERAFTGDGRALPVHFCIVYWNTAEERVVCTEIYRDGYIPVEGIHLPVSRRITIADDSGTSTWHVHFRDHVLLVRDSSEKRAG